MDGYNKDMMHISDTIKNFTRMHEVQQHQVGLSGIIIGAPFVLPYIHARFYLNFHRWE